LRTVQTGPVIGLISQLVLLAALAATLGLNGPGWVVGIVYGVITNAVLAGGLSRRGGTGLGPADRVTLVRATLVGGVAALTADSFGRTAPVTAMVVLTVVALVLDAVDGWVARRTETVTLLGARFDLEVDSFLILVLSVYVARSLGAWVLAIGVARYAFVAAGLLLPWLRGSSAPRYWCKVVAAIQGIVLTVAMADLLPHPLMDGVLVAALALLAESFGREVWWLWRHRGAESVRVTFPAKLGTLVAGLLVWFALVAPDKLSLVTPGAFVRIPLEGLVILALALVLRPGARRAAATAFGVVLALLAIVKVLDMGFFAVFDRPFDPLNDWFYLGPGIGVLGDSIGRAGAIAATIGAAVLVLGLVTAMPLAVVRLTRLVASHRRVSTRAVTGLGIVWVLCAVTSLQFDPGARVASVSAAGLAYDQVSQLRDDLADRQTFAKEIATDPLSKAADNQLLTGLRGKDVILAFVESYGRVAVQGTSFSPGVDAVLKAGTSQLRSVGFSSRSAFLTSPTFGAGSWLAHSTLQSGLWVDSQQRYDQLLTKNRLTLTDAFGQAGWRTVFDVPANTIDWPEGANFYHFDKLYDSRNVGYHGPKFSYAPMPDQYVLSAFERQELAKTHRAPVMAEIDLVSSHHPWTPLPHLVAWNKVGDGSIFDDMPAEGESPDAAFRDPDKVRALYGQSIEYTLSSLFSFVQTNPDPNLVLIVVGDHQPHTYVSGENPGHDVPISIIAHDPAVMSRISGWGWQAGMLPSPAAPVWRMDTFRDRFLTAYGPRVRRVPAAGVPASAGRGQR
jgi:phosphatidylglycerophosphate synthase